MAAVKYCISLVLVSLATRLLDTVQTLQQIWGEKGLKEIR